jgi:hypothetical protein
LQFFEENSQTIRDDIGKVVSEVVVPEVVVPEEEYKEIKPGELIDDLPENFDPSGNLIGSLGRKGDPLQLTKLRAAERDKVIHRILNSWDDDMANQLKNKHRSMWELFWPVATCSREDRIGQLGDGGKWMCNVDKIQAPCTIYSIGSAGDITFEKVFSQYPGCDTLTFDPTPNLEDQVKDQLSPNMKYIPVGLGPVGGDIDNPIFNLTLAGETVKTISLMNLIKEYGLGVANKLDVLKVDIEGCEKRAVPFFLEEDGFDDLKIKIITMEYHGEEYPLLALSIISQFQEHGYYVYHLEHNYRSTDCMEFSFVHESHL